MCHPIDPVAILVIVSQRRNARQVLKTENKNSLLSMDFVRVSLFFFFIEILFERRNTFF